VRLRKARRFLLVFHDTRFRTRNDHPSSQTQLYVALTFPHNPHRSPPAALAHALTDTGHPAGALKPSAAGAASGWRISVAYPHNLTVHDGLRLKPSQAASPPRVHVEGPGSFTLAMVDPDAPSPDAPKARSWLHWLVANARPAGAVGEGGNGDVLCAYNGPTPPRGE